MSKVATRSIALATFNTCEFLIRVISKEMDVEFLYIYIYICKVGTNKLVYLYVRIGYFDSVYFSF